METISIITTTRNRRDFTKCAIESVLAQDYPAIEHVVVDAASSDGTPELLKQYEVRYREKGFILRWISEPDSGLTEGINKRIRLSTGTYFCLLHDDDRLEPGAVAKFAKAFREHPDMDCIYGDHYTVWPNGDRQLDKHRLYSLHDMARSGYQIPQGAFLCKRSLVDRFGYWDESLKHVAEPDVFMRFAKNGARFLYIPIPFQTVEIHAERTTSKYFMRTVEETKMVNFRHGGGYFSRYYVLYLRDRYFNDFFERARRKTPRLFNAVKKVFNKLTNRT